MTPANLTLYSGLAVIVFGAYLWLKRRALHGANTLDFLGLHLSSNSPGMLVMGVGLALVLASQHFPGSSDQPTVPASNTQQSDSYPPQVNPATQVSEFKFDLSGGRAPESAGREWKRVAPDRWAERYPAGNISYFEVTDRLSLDGCAGEVVKSLSDTAHRVFIPDKGCVGMPLYVNDNNRWLVVTHITDVK